MLGASGIFRPFRKLATRLFEEPSVIRRPLPIRRHLVVSLGNLLIDQRTRINPSSQSRFCRRKTSSDGLCVSLHFLFWFASCLLTRNCRVRPVSSSVQRTIFTAWFSLFRIDNRKRRRSGFLLFQKSSASLRWIVPAGRRRSEQKHAIGFFYFSSKKNAETTSESLASAETSVAPPSEKPLETRATSLRVVHPSPGADEKEIQESLNVQ